MTFISDLFPPPPPQYTDEMPQDDRPKYSFGYLTDLTRCWSTCVSLSYYLAAYAVQHHLQTDSMAQVLWSSSKTEKEFIYTKGVSLLQSRILRPMYRRLKSFIIDNRLTMSGLTSYISSNLMQVTHQIHPLNPSTSNTPQKSKRPSYGARHSMIPKSFSLPTTACIFFVLLSAAL